MKLIRLVVYTILFLAMPTAGFFIFVNQFSPTLWLSGPATIGFAYVQKELYDRAMIYEYMTKYMHVSKRKAGLYLITKPRMDQ